MPHSNQQYRSLDTCKAACIAASKASPSQCFYIRVLNSSCYEIAAKSEYGGEPFYRNGALVVPENTWLF